MSANNKEENIKKNEKSDEESSLEEAKSSDKNNEEVKEKSVEGKLKGNISMRMRGTNGFGYDPIFIPLKKEITFGQMSKSKKIKMDHRYLAFKKLKKKIKI